MATIADKTVLVTGANRGIGHALVEEALKRGAKRVYAGTRQAWAHPHERVTRVALDVTNQAQVQEAVDTVGPLDVLVNNAGVLSYDDLSDRGLIEQHLAVNLFGTIDVTQAFLPLLARPGGRVINNLSVNALAPLPMIPAYSISKAATFSFTQSLRALLGGTGITVHAVLTGPVDTDLIRAFDTPKASASSVAQAIFNGVENEEEDIFPDPASATLAESWRTGAVKGLERWFATLAGPSSA
jgi:NAD(P)-dependent dehydrogenase (short-subunit alcohol dehydrogenase family)